MSLSLSEQEDLKMLLNISSAIYKSFIDLLYLEKNIPTSEKSQELINNIYSLKLLENSIIERLFNSSSSSIIDMINAIKEELLKEDEKNSLDDELDVAISNNRDRLIRRRVIIKLLDKEKTERLQRDIFNNSFMQYERLLKQDFMNTILTILNEYLNNPKFALYNSVLLQLKYNLGFLYEFIGDDLLENYFNLNPELYWSAQLHADLKHISPHFVKSTNVRFVRTLIDSCIEEILDNPSNNLKNIMLQIILRASLLFVGDDIVESFKNSINKQIFANTMMKISCQGEELLIETFNMNSQDKELPKIVHLGVSL